MTTKEARVKLKSEYPEHHYWSVCENAVDYGIEGYEDSMNYTVSIQPGLDGSECSVGKGDTLDEAFADLASQKVPVATA